MKPHWHIHRHLHFSFWALFNSYVNCFLGFQQRPHLTTFWKCGTDQLPRNVERNVHTIISFPNPFLESGGLISGMSKNSATIFGHFWRIRQQQPFRFELESIFDFRCSIFNFQFSIFDSRLPLSSNSFFFSFFPPRNGKYHLKSFFRR